MSDSLQAVTIKAPGWRGLNTQDTQINDEIGWASVADNCVFDENNRIAARLGYVKVNTSDSFGTQIIRTAAYKTSASANTIITTTSGGIYSGTGANLVDLTDDGTSPLSPSDGYWKFVTFNDTSHGVTCIGVQENHTPIYHNGTDFIPVTYPATGSNLYDGFPINGNEALSAFGRLWVVSQDRTTVAWCKLRDFDTNAASWTGGGYLNVSAVWPDGSDYITALAAFEGKLIIFGEHNILIYQNPYTPDDTNAPLTLNAGTNATKDGLSGTIAGIGCIARDSVQFIGDDIFFLSHLGIRSLKRSMITESLPASDISANVRDYLVSYTQGLADYKVIDSVFDEEHGYYLLLIPTGSGSATSTTGFYVDTKIELQDGTRRITRWPGLPHRTAVYDNAADEAYFGTGDGFLARETGYQDDGNAYTMEYVSTWKDFDNDKLKFPKKMSMIVTGGSSYQVNFQWGFDFNDNLYNVTSSYAGQTQDPSEWNNATAEWGEQPVGLFDDWAASTTYYAYDRVVPTAGGSYFYTLAPEVWATGTAYAAYSIVEPTTANDYVYVCDNTGGTSHASTEPTWPTTEGDTVADNGMTWTCVAIYNSTTGIGTSAGSEPSWDTSSPDGETADNELLWKTRALTTEATEWSGEGALSSKVHAHLSKNGQHLRYGWSTSINGNAFAINRLDLFVKIGRLNRSVY